ncbi:hypoxanthine phosphoribosyltransferase protein [Marine Group I thaumarchaeote SCGC AAA799-D07]|nr:hypoxanthine phosphoribosyltransferase protein [Marine Group I thaumarchaeote SCGC AAA799-D07]
MKCDKCENTAVYSRKYSGENLCSECFSNSILRKAAKTISKYKMIKNNELVCVAVSGGKDSLVLLDILNKMSKTHSFRIFVVTIDEGIPGYRDEALKIVEKFCAQLKIEHKTFSYKKLFDLTLEESLELRGDHKLSSCSICGTFRRRALDHAAKVINADVIATGHNLDDTLQTFLINILSGDAKKIGWMNPDTSSKKARKIKPLSEIYESEIVFYAFTNNLPFQTEPCPHMNEGIRTEIREFLNSLELNHDGIKNNMYRTVLKISQITNKTSDKEKRLCLVCGNQCTGRICSVCNMLTNLKD